MGDLVQVLCFENALAFKVGMIDIVLLYKVVVYTLAVSGQY
jgi:hypothetical protein